MVVRQFVQPGSDTKGLDNLSLDSKQVSHFIFLLASRNQENFPSHSFWKFRALFLSVLEPEVDGSGLTFDCEGLSGVSAVFSDVVSSTNFLFLKLPDIKSVNRI